MLTYCEQNQWVIFNTLFAVSVYSFHATSRLRIHHIIKKIIIFKQFENESNLLVREPGSGIWCASMQFWVWLLDYQASSSIKSISCNQTFIYITFYYFELLQILDWNSSRIYELKFSLPYYKVRWAANTEPLQQNLWLISMRCNPYQVNESSVNQ